MGDNDLDAALEVRFDSDAGDGLTVREYLHRLLSLLWELGDGFSGKRPFGNSGWDYELYQPLVRAGFISGALDEDGWLDDVDCEQGSGFVQRLIDRAFNLGSPDA